MLFKNDILNSKPNKLTYYLEETNINDNYPSLKFNKKLTESDIHNIFPKDVKSNSSSYLKSIKSDRISYNIPKNTTFDYKKDLKNIGINCDSSESSDISYNNIKTDINAQYKNELNNNYNNYDYDNLYSSKFSNSNQTYKYKPYTNLYSNITLNNNCFKKGNNTEALSNYLSDLTKNKMKKLEIAKRSTYLNPFGSNLSYLNIHNYIRDNYDPYKGEKKYYTEIPSKTSSKEKNNNYSNEETENKITKGKIKKNKRKISNESFEKMFDKDNILKSYKKENKIKNENSYNSENEQFEELESDDNNNINDNNLSKIENKKQKENPKLLNDNILNTQDESFVKFLKEENEHLKNLSNIYKQLIDSLFYFVNDLSHKFSYYQELFDISYYIQHVNDLSKTLIGLEYCILSQSDPKNGKETFEEFKKNMGNEFYKKFKLPFPFKLINEISFQIPDNFKFENNNDNNNNNSKLDTLNQHSFIKDKRVNSQSKDNSRIYNEKKEHDCVACNLGYSISQKGYSTMAYNPYINNNKTFIGNIKKDSNKNLIKQIPKSLSQKYNIKKNKNIK